MDYWSLLSVWVFYIICSWLRKNILFFFISLTMYLSYTVILNSDYVSELGYAST